MGHDHMLNMKLYGTKDKLQNIFISWTIGTHRYKTQKIPIMIDDGKSDKYMIP